MNLSEIRALCKGIGLLLFSLGIMLPLFTDVPQPVRYGLYGVGVILVLAGYLIGSRSEE